jgi:hypothetical protein
MDNELSAEDLKELVQKYKEVTFGIRFSFLTRYAAR